MIHFQAHYLSEYKVLKGQATTWRNMKLVEENSNSEKKPFI